MSLGSFGLLAPQEFVANLGLKNLFSDGERDIPFPIKYSMSRVHSSCFLIGMSIFVG